MSYPKPRKINNRAKLVYPSAVRMEDNNWVSTGPYVKDFHGHNLENVKGYLANIVDKYEDEKKKQIEKVKKLLKEQEVINEPDSK